MILILLGINNTSNTNNLLNRQISENFSNCLNNKYKENDLECLSFNNQIINGKKPSLDNLPFMRSNSGISSDMNNIQNINPNLINQARKRSKKEEMKKWHSKI